MAIFIIFPDSRKIVNIIRCFLPIIFNNNWYFSAYVCVFLFIPFINKLLDNINDEQLSTYLSITFVLFSVIVIFHELGHFLLAKKNGICVEEFAIGIGPTIFGKQIGETKYSVKCLPFGGCCVMLGEDDACQDFICMCCQVRAFI